MTTTTGLPKGYDDPTNVFFVPEAWRDQYLMTSPARPRDGLAANRVAHKIAEAETRASYKPFVNPRQTVVSQGARQEDEIMRLTRQEAQKMLADKLDWLNDVADHQSRVRLAGLTVEQNERNAAISAENHVLTQCPVCGENAGKIPDRRTLPNGVEFTSCDTCLVIAKQFAIASVMATSGRRDRVNAYMQDHHLI